MILISGEALIDLIPDPVKANAYDAVSGRVSLQCCDRPRPSRLGDGVRLAYLGRRQRRSARRRARRQPRRPWNGRSRQAALDSGVRDAWDGKDWVSLLVLSRRDRLRRSLALSHGMAQRAGRHLHVGSFSAVERHGEAVVEAMRVAHPLATVSFDPNIRPFVTPDREAVRPLVERQASLASHGQGQRGGPRVALPGPLGRGEPVSLDENGSALLRSNSGRTGRARHSGQGTNRGRRPLASMSSTPSAPATVSCPPSFRRWTVTPRLAQMRRAPSRREVETVAALRCNRVRHHLHPQGVGPADARRGRGGAESLKGRRD